MSEILDNTLDGKIAFDGNRKTFYISSNKLFLYDEHLPLETIPYAHHLKLDKVVIYERLIIVLDTDHNCWLLRDHNNSLRNKLLHKNIVDVTRKNNVIFFLETNGIVHFICNVAADSITKHCEFSTEHNCGYYKFITKGEDLFVVDNANHVMKLEPLSGSKIMPIIFFDDDHRTHHVSPYEMRSSPTLISNGFYAILSDENVLEIIKKGFDTVVLPDVKYYIKSTIGYRSYQCINVVTYSGDVYEFVVIQDNLSYSKIHDSPLIKDIIVDRGVLYCIDVDGHVYIIENSICAHPVDSKVKTTNIIIDRGIPDIKNARKV